MGRKRKKFQSDKPPWRNDAGQLMVADEWRQKRAEAIARQTEQNADALARYHERRRSSRVLRELIDDPPETISEYLDRTDRRKLG